MSQENGPMARTSQPHPVIDAVVAGNHVTNIIPLRDLTTNLVVERHRRAVIAAFLSPVQSVPWLVVTTDPAGLY